MIARVLLVACVCCFGCVSSAKYDALQLRYDDLDGRHEATLEEVSVLEAVRDGYREQFTALELQYARLEARTQVLEEMVGALREMGACIRRLQIEVEGGKRPGP